MPRGRSSEQSRAEFFKLTLEHVHKVQEKFSQLGVENRFTPEILQKISLDTGVPPGKVVLIHHYRHLTDQGIFDKLRGLGAKGSSRP